MTDVVIDAWRSVRRRAQRSLLTTLGIALGIGALVAVVGLASSGALQIERRFDAYAATAVQVTLSREAARAPETYLVNQLRRLYGVRAAGIFTPLGSETTRPVFATSVRNQRRQTLPIVVASAAGLRAADPVVVSGQLPGRWVLTRDRSVIVLGLGAARTLQAWPRPGLNVVSLNGQPFVVVAVVKDRGAEATLSASAVLGPQATARLDLGSFDVTLLVRTTEGAGQSVADAAPYAVSPERPGTVIAQVPPAPTELRGRISSDTRDLLLALGAVTLLAGAVGIANNMLVSVWERRAEIGLRRALGASRRDVFALFVLESSMVGTVGGIVGSAAGILVSAAMAAARQWPPALPPWVLAAPLLGAVVGIAAAVYPAMRAAGSQPVEALRG